MFDNVSKFLIEQHSEDFANWLIGEPIALSELSPSELSLEPIRADALILLQSSQVILHCEFQTDPDPTMPFRMADYALRVYRRFPHKRLVQVVIYLRSTQSELVKQTSFTANHLRHEFQAIRLWEEPTEIFLQRPGLLPYAVLSQTSDCFSVLQQVAQTINSLPDRNQQANVAAATGILAGLVLSKQVIRRLLRRELMQESVIYQELCEEAKAEVRQEVLQQVRQEVRQEVLQQVRQEVRQEMLRQVRQEVRQEMLQQVRQEVRQEVLQQVRQEVQQEVLQQVRQEMLQETYSMILRQLKRRFGILSQEIQSRVHTLSLDQLQDLGEAFMDFSTVADLAAWLETEGKITE
jgi:predicted transposase/invertase (TIGR01784 family)